MQTRSIKNYKGIDISSWQGNVDFKKIKDSGIQIVYIKATESNKYIQSTMEKYHKGAKENGLLVGFYHFFRANVDAKLQAKYFASAIEGKSMDCKLVLDIETTEGVDAEALTNMCIVFLEEVKKLTGKEVAIYTYTSFANSSLTSKLSSYPLWIAHYGVVTPGTNRIWNEWVGFQYSEKGVVPGINGNCDIDEFTEGILLSRNTGTAHQKTKIDYNKKEVTYTVKAGDTLSTIASKFNTTWQELAKKNKISNPNIIKVGQILKI